MNQSKYNKYIVSNRVKFYAACIILALDDLHSNNILYRDLKLENLLVDDCGYLKVGDFSLSKIMKTRDKTFTFCGTPEYLSPEIIKGEGYDRKADIWALGIIIYELLFGIAPFFNSDIMKLYENICFTKLNFPERQPLTMHCEDLIKRLLNKNPDERLGYSGAKEIKDHFFFHDISFDDIYSKKLTAPISNQVKDPLAVSNFEQMFTSEEVRYSLIEESDMKKIKEHIELFNNF